MGLIEAILITVITASTPLLIAAIGELVTERSGVLNLGVEGMMLMGAVTGFVTGYSTGSVVLGAIAGIVAGMAMAALFAFLVLGIVVNQVASGLALTILGIGLSGLIGANYTGLRLEQKPPAIFGALADLPYAGKLLFSHDFFVYAAFALVILVAWFLTRTRAGLTLRAVGESHTSAHALGVPVRRLRLYAILFGGACAGLAGAHLSLAYTPFWVTGMTAGRGWIALAIVVFASWLPWRAMAGAYLFGGVTIAQLQVQGFGLGIPSQLMSSLPYLATIVVLVIISRTRTGSSAPAHLGVPFWPDR
ncbi:MAG: ABC transporter permease [Hyphomicrobiaceae bacterium]|nr:ABC transporter permease [Hyphomicrobiaceae bacterium]